MVQVLWYWVPVVLYAGVIFFLSAQSHPEDQLPSFLFKEVSDKVLHAVEYGILSLLCYRAYRWAAGPAVARQAVVLAILTASVYGFTDEAHQAFVPLRESSWQDWLADTLGATLAAVAVGRVTKTSLSV
jgi:VanZ family protein